MKKLTIVGVFLVLTRRAKVEGYNDVAKAPTPAGLEGYWQPKGPQHNLVSPEAAASLVITKEGDTPGCRQWRRAVALPGKLAMLSGDLTNVMVKHELYEIKREGNTLGCDDMTPQRMDHLTQECIDALKKMPLATPLP